MEAGRETVMEVVRETVDSASPSPPPSFLYLGNRLPAPITPPVGKLYDVAVRIVDVQGAIVRPKLYRSLDRYASLTQSGGPGVERSRLHEHGEVDMGAATSAVKPDAWTAGFGGPEAKGLIRAQCQPDTGPGLGPAIYLGHAQMIAVEGDGQFQVRYLQYQLQEPACLQLDPLYYTFPV